MKRGVLFLALVIVLLAAVPLASASDFEPARHPPTCVRLPTLSRDILLYLHCEDIGADIHDAFLMRHSVPLQYEIKQDNDVAEIFIYRPPWPYGVWLNWCVDDDQGNETLGSFVWYPPGPTDEAAPVAKADTLFAARQR